MIPPTWSASEFLLATGHEHVCKERNVRITCFRVRSQSSVCHCHPRISVCLFLPCTWHIRRLIDNINIDLDSGSSHQVHTFSVLQVMFETRWPIMLTDTKESQVQLLTTQFVWHDWGMRDACPFAVPVASLIPQLIPMLQTLSKSAKFASIQGHFPTF